MSLRNLILAGLLLVGVWGPMENVLAQLPDQTNRIYTLTNGSSLTDGCLACDRPTIEVPMTGTFRLRFLGQGPLFAQYQIEDISFHAGIKGGVQYSVSGSGTYQVGGEVSVFQDVFLDAQIDNGFVTTRALCVNPDRSVTQPWPEIQVTADQTNGTATEVYDLTLVAVPALQFRAIIPDRQKGDITLQWDRNGGYAQLERALILGGPYSPISPITTNQTFTDVGALTNRTLFYRLRQY